jgi:hypothetical protein
MGEMKSLRFSDKSIPLLVVLTSILAYGLLIPWTGFYWDDWPFAWIAKSFGPAAFIPAFRGFRPFLGPIFTLTTALVPPRPLSWQLFALLVHCGAGLSAWWSLNRIWPEHKRQALITALFLLVFPGYSQHWVAFTHINQEWIPFIFYLLSFGYTARALRDRDNKRSNSIFALLLLAGGLFPTEYFIGLEPLRFLFIFAIVSEETQGLRPRLLQSLKAWGPYLAIWLLNAAWLAYYYKSGAYISYEVALDGTQVSPGRLLSFPLEALWKAGLYAWLQFPVLAARSLTAPSTLLALALALIAFLLLAFYFTRLDLAAGGDGWARQAILIGVIGILLGRVPSLAAGLPLTLQSSYDRFMISMMLGASLFMAGLLELIPRARLKPYAAALLIALAIGQQFFNANIFRRDWARQQEIFWQFAWRIPALKPYTIVLTHEMPLDYETDLSMTAPLNWIYGADFEGAGLPYVMLYTEKRVGGSVLPDLEPDTIVQVPYRTQTYHGTTSQAIVIYVPAHGCLRVLDPAFEDEKIYEKLPRVLTDAIPLSDPSRILADSPEPVLPSPPFTREPARTWCYFYEKAELARQIRDWKEITRLGEQAAQAGFAPEDAVEWLPFIEADIYAGSLGDAKALSRTVYAGDPRIRKALCVVWTRFSRDTGLAEAAAEPLAEFGCGQ